MTDEEKKEEDALIDQDLDAEEELPPPEEENEAREVNVGNIIGVIVIGLLVIFLIAFIAVNISGRKKKQQESDELDKAGTKTVIGFQDKSNVEHSSSNKEEDRYTFEATNTPASEDEEELPLEFQLPVQGEAGKAPVAAVGSTSSGSYKSERPDTRNSKSLRKIEGLAGLNYSTVQQGQDLVSQIMSGNYGTKSYGQKMTKEEFVAQQLAQTQSLQEQLNGPSTGSGTTGFGTGTASVKESFFSASSGTGGSGSYLSKAALWDGTIISGVLITAINTDNPGVVIARVTENVYSSQDHSYLLIPEGSLLMATYNSSVSYGQNKVQVAWNLLIRPDNYRVQLGNMNGVNAQGASGYKGLVSNHPFETLKALGMVAVYSIIQTEITNEINSQQNEYLQNAMTDVYAQASSLGNKIVDRALDIKPTIKIKEGTEIKLITNVPMELPPVEVVQATQKYVRTR